MSAMQAVLSETSRSFDLRGRTARADYLRFLAFSVMLFGLVIAGWIVALPQDQSVIGIYLTTAVFYLPVTAAGVRRLHDVGETGALMLDPLKPALGFAIVLALLWLVSAKTAVGSATFFISLLFFGKVLAALLLVGAVIAISASLIAFSNTMGLLLLPSQPGPNRYGPNPNEVPS